MSSVPRPDRRSVRWLIAATLLLTAMVARPEPARACELGQPVTFLGGCVDESFVGPVHIGFLGLWAATNNDFYGLAQVGLKTYVAEDYYGLAQVGLSNDVGGQMVNLVQFGMGNNTGILINRVTAEQDFLFNVFDLYSYNYEFDEPTGFSFNLLQVGAIYNACGRCSLIQVAGLMNTSVEFYGLQLSPIHNRTDVLGGWQHGIYNWAEEAYGLQTGTVNHSEHVRGVQIGTLNFADTVKGLQIGLYNQANRLAGVQIGLLNTIKDNWLPWMVLINIGVY